MPVSKRLLALALVVSGFQAMAAGPDPAPAVDPDTVFKGARVGGAAGTLAELLASDRRIAVPLFRVAFTVESSISAEVLAGRLPGRTPTGGQSSLRVTLTGVEVAAMQRVTDAAYAALLAQLEAAGREVVPPAELEPYRAGFKAVEAPPGQPYTSAHGGRTVLFLAPTGMPVVLTHLERAWDERQVGDPSNHRKLQELSAQLDAAVIAPIVFVDFARMRSTGRQSGRFGESAEARAELAVSVVEFGSIYVRPPQGSLAGSDEGTFQLAAPVLSPNEFGSLHVMSRQVNGAYELPGSPRAGAVLADPRSSVVSHAAAQTSNAAWSAAANDALEAAAIALGQWFRKHSPEGREQDGVRLRITNRLPGKR